MGVTVAKVHVTEAKDKKKLILPTLIPYNKVLPTKISYQGHKTTFDKLSILILQK